MQHLTSVIWSLDNKFILSASDEMNIRIWKANASEKLGTVSYFVYLNVFFVFLMFFYQLR
jgi:peptidoglycan/LPS O-acetylase OafA/YrhL